MKSISVKSAIILILLLTAATAQAAGEISLSACVVDEKDQPVDYATVVVLQGGVQKGGAISGDNGCFTLPIPSAGRYSLKVSYVGLKTYTDTLDITAAKDLGKIVLAHQATTLKEVVVKASPIRREADRFVVLVENQPSAIGKDGKQLLKEAPGVWIDHDNKISINGKSNPKVYVNDRELRMTDDQLATYLQTLPSNEISKIEVVPRSGAEYSADSASGIIKITLKKNRGTGLIGEVGANAEFSKHVQSVRPHASVNYNTGKFTLNFGLRGNINPKNEMRLEENTTYKNSSAVLQSGTQINGSQYNGTATAGAFYDFNPRNTLGMEVELTPGQSKMPTSSTSLLSQPDATTATTGSYSSTDHDTDVNVKVNYINRLDTAGSTLKVLANYLYRKSTNTGDNYFKSDYESAAAKLLRDSTYRSDTRVRYNVLNVGADLDKNLGKTWTVKGGVKYTLNDMYNYAYYDYQKGTAWIPSTAYNYALKYDENIFALYAIGLAKYGRWGLKGGVRGEYTHAQGEGSYVTQNYFDLFPDLNVSYALTERQDYSLSMGYSRNISRPNFWALNPVRRQISDYSYQVGNPRLRPSYTYTTDATLVMAYRYTLSVSFSHTSDIVRQKFTTDPANPNNIYLTYGNEASESSLNVYIGGPIQVTKWMMIVPNITYVHSMQKENADSKWAGYNYLFCGASTTFTLPDNFYISADVFYHSRVHQGNMIVSPNTYGSVSVKKTLCDRRWTLSAGIDNIFQRGEKVTAISTSYDRHLRINQYRSFTASVTYNFNSGKKFKVKKVEDSNDSSRLMKSN